ncbi:MAG TPA: ubiquitin-like domain-containing protein [Aeromicrobium sp.]|nr:ubiquitin-like domain-containing protein [Aeromicrobium sp.]
MRIPSLTPKHLHKLPHKKNLFIALNAVVLLVLAGSTAAYAGLSKTVTVTLDGEPTTVRTFGDSVEAVLAADGIALGPKDRIQVAGKAASAGTLIDDGDDVAVAFAKPVAVAVDGKVKKATTHERTVGEVLKGLGVQPTPEAYVSSSLGEPLSRSGNQIVVSNRKTVTVEADGEQENVKSTAPTVEEALEAADVKLDGNDEVQPALGDLVAAGDTIKVTRIEQVEKTEEVDVDQPVKYQDDDTLEKGTAKVLEPGRPGRARERVLLTVADGEQRSRLVLESTELAEPKIKLVARGTAAAPEAPYGVWDKIAACESGGNWHINTGNGYYGGLQFSAATWRSVGGPGLPHENSREVQIKYAKILQARSGWGQWGCAGARNN